ncbi:MAG: amino acid adenylation domain-containing protein, partial [Acidobacteria bacterium]|nr:amino acid adenylation domain-containing protein [Acidobacteriota bacterium]
MKKHVLIQGKWNPDDIEDIYPMSEIEKGMVFSYMKYAGVGIYHDQFVLPLHLNNFDFEIFRKSLRLLVEKNEILRTAFNLDEFEEPIQIVYKEPVLNLLYNDLKDLSPQEQIARIDGYLSDDRKNPFESSKSPLWRIHIFTYENDRFFLILSVHHAILDGWSNSILLTELYNTYFELKKNPLYVPPRLKACCKDAVIEERIEKENTRAVRYWQEELKDYTRLEFSDTFKSKEELEPMKIYHYNAGKEILKKAKQRAMEWRTTIKNLCFSAYAYMMRMFSYENDMVLGCVTNNRPNKLDGDNILGCFLNTIPVRLSITDGLSWKEYVAMVEQKMLEGKKHERLPLFEIALAIGEKNKDRNPIFDTLFNFTDFHSYHQIEITESGRDILEKMSPYRSLIGRFDTNTLFDFELDITSGDFFLHPKYNAQVISDYMVKKCCTYFINILEKYINSPDSLARRDDILPLEEKENLLHHFNDTAAPYSREKTMHQLFEEQVLKTKDRTAVIDSDGLGHLTYQELNERANQLAYGLRKIGVKKSDFVGVIMERCMEMGLAVMAILKAGGAYVPLEPHLPERRIEKILESLHAACVITDITTRPKLESMTFEIIIPAKTKSNEFKDNPVSLVSPGDISYIIYTSGSTGIPKGVVETHRPVVNVIEWVNKTFAVGQNDKLLFVTSLGFDLSVYDIFGILASGGTIRTAGSADMKEPLKLLAIILREGITFWDSAPAALQQLVPFFNELNEAREITNLRLIFLSGDWIPVNMPDALRNTFRGVQVISLGGATEATIWSNYYPIGHVEPSWPSIPYGKPIQNARYYILDTDLYLCPIEIGGDLYIGGECLAKEYKNDPELTAAKFSDNPFCPGEKMYKTGDIARWLADGNMQFLGRKDHQVKIRGYRIELGEIESQLASFSGLREAIVIDRKDSRGNKYICAYYIVKKAGEKISPGDLQSYLSRELPEYMMPSYFIAIDKIPVTANGKLDRKALPEPELHLTEKSYNGPGDELQEKLVDIWQEVLFGHTEKAAIGIDDDFFQLGGHSLNAAVVVAKIHKITHVKVPLAEIFRRPTIRELSELINKSNKEKYAEIQVLEKKEYYLLSSAQKRLYFLRQLEPDNVTYNLPTIISLSGEVQIKKIEDVFKYLVKRHDSLRTSFHMIGGEPVQRIHDHVEFAIEYLAADIIGDKEKNIHYSSFIIHRFIRPFDLTQVPLLRVGAVQYEEKYLLLLDMHHIITDGISTQVLKQDFMALYNGEKLPGLRIQYKDFAGWQNSNKENEELKRQELYWLKEFSEKAQAINIPTDYPRPLMQNHEGKNLIFEVPTKEAQALIALALKENATLFIILTTILNILLMKISGQEDIVIGTPAAGRGHADLEKVIGMFVNTLALRSFPLEEKKFTYYLQEVREKTIKALENQDFQYEDLIEKIIVKRDLSRNPLFDTMFTLQNMEMAAINIPSLKLSSCPYENKIAIFDLSLTAVEMEKKLMFRFEYCTKLFKEETINRFIDYFKNIINSVIENKERRIADIEIINEEEKKQILFEFNDTVRKFPKDKTIHQLFVEQALKIPDRIAVIGSNVTTVETLRATSLHLTYFQLNDQSNRLAGLLIEKGVLPDAVVGIMMEWTIEMIVGVLGILKSGGAYLPIDPGYPQERISYMLKDSGAKLLAVANNQEGEKVRKWEGEKVLLESILHPANHLFYQHSAFSILHPNHLCYIIYTSGSTGKPKGVMVEHRNVVRLVKNTDYITLSPRDRLLPTGSLAFDITTFEIWGPLCNGIMLVLVSKDILLNTGKLKKALVNYGITILHLIPALFNQLAADDMKLFAGLRYFLVGGDKVSPFYINDLRRKYNHLKILHMYGPTENTTFSTFFPVGQDYEFNIPIGKPIANNTAYIVDKFGYLQPMGVMGELCVGGEGLARGYLNNPELTTDRFNWSYKSNKTYISYKTGDLARWLPDGNIEFMGRQDNQVKIRGFRIEIGEIENLLLNHHDIGEAVVLCKKDKTNDNYLCAYIVPINTGRIDKANPVFSGLKEYLSQSLPAYMIPQYFMELEKMPLNPNGKIDRKALSELQISKFEFNKYAPPRNKIEEKLTFIWSEVLSMEKEKISIDANFFELGGHSLKATKLVTNVHKEFNVKLPLSEVFRTSTISGLAKYIKGTAAETYLSIIPTEKKEYYRLSAAQKRLYLILQMEPKSTVYNMTSAVLMEGKLDKERLEETFKKLIMRHESLRTSFHLIDGIPAQVVHESVDFKPRYYEIEAGDETAVRAKIETLVRDVTPFDLSNPPLMMVNLVKVAEMRYYMVFDMHHIISDGTSSAIFIKEFTALYDRMEFPPLKIRYCDYAEWQNREREKERIKKQEEYWLKQFEGEVPILKLPIDFSRPTLQNFEGERIFFKISGADTAALNRLALAQETTLYTVLLSLYYILLHKLSRQEDIVIGAPTAGRIHADLQDLIGMFLNTLTLRHYPGPGKTFTGFLSEVKTGVLNALENQEYQFDELVDKLELDRDTSRNPLFDVMFILQNLEIPELQIPGLKIKPTGYLTGTTKFDLSLYAIESGQVINFNFNYSTKLFEPATIEIFIKYFKNILSSVLKTPGINIADIQYVSSEDRENIVKHFNRDLRQEAEAVLAGKRVFQEKLNEIFAKYPDHTAIEYADKTITYSQLDLRSNYVARWIISQGIPKQTFIGILIDERAELITMVLGIIKAGCVFVSIDSSYPDQRIETMIETTDMKIILVDKTNNHRFANNETVKKQNVELRIFETLFLDTHLNPSWFVDKVVMEYDPADRL